MKIKFISGKQREFLLKTKMLKKCTWNELAAFLKINFESLKNWNGERRCIPEYVFVKILNSYPELQIYKKFIAELKENNWGQVKGGIAGSATVKERLKNPKYKMLWIKKCRVGGTNNIKRGLIRNWDVGFRNVGRRRFIGPNGEKMFTKAEKQIADFFVKNNIEYKYEPHIILNGNNYFPDFMIGKIIIERCGLASKKYFVSLRRKLNDYFKCKEKVILVLPKKIEKSLNKNVKINKKFITLIEDDNLSELAKLLENYGVE